MISYNIRVSFIVVSFERYIIATHYYDRHRRSSVARPAFVSCMKGDTRFFPPLPPGVLMPLFNGVSRKLLSRPSASRVNGFLPSRCATWGHGLTAVSVTL